MAARFRFRLETVLKVRTRRERDAQRKVAAKRAEIARVEELNRQTDDEISTRQGGLRAELERGSPDPSELTRSRAWIAHLRSTLAQRQSVRAALLTELARLQDEWSRARVEMRVIEKLRERRWSEYVHARDAAEQAEADELARSMLGMNT